MSAIRNEQIYFWIMTGVIVGLAVLVHLYRLLQSRRRLSRRGTPVHSAPAQLQAVTTAAVRQLVEGPPPFAAPAYIPSLHLGKSSLVLGWLAAIVALCFGRYNVFDVSQYEEIARRAGNIAIVQLPLVFLLAQKQSLLCHAIGLSYERVYWLHKWIPRVFLITVTIHMSYWFRLWNRTEGESIMARLSDDRRAKTGFAAWTILAFLTVVSFAPIRKLSYEVFYLLHITLAGGLLAAIYMHLRNNYVYFWLSIALVSADRLIRLVNKAWVSSPRLRGKKQAFQDATFELLPGNATRITVHKPLMKWQPGQHVYLSCYKLLPFQSHPFTIASLPSDNKLEIILQPQAGGTKRFYNFAAVHNHGSERGIPIKPVAFEGPYGFSHSLHQYTSVVFFAGSSGAAYTVPLLRELLQRRQKGETIATRRVRFVWAIKSRDMLCWFQDVLEEALAQARTTQGELVVEAEVYITQATIADHPASGDLESDGSSASESSLEEKALGTSQQPSRPSLPTPLSSSSGAESSDSSVAAAKKHSLLALRSGRPDVRSIIALASQEAHGETAVVCCGPRSLQDNVRRSVHGERNVRGLLTGKKLGGIALHLEGFSY
jgi:predicted ferric reductase